MPKGSLRTAQICGAEGLALGWAALATIGCCFIVLYARAFVIIGGQAHGLGCGIGCHLLSVSACTNVSGDL
jgi:hypothetical protein